jgi:hypothetical protein
LHGEFHLVDKLRLNFAFWTAGANWLCWKNDFEHSGRSSYMPVLANQERYEAFLSEYSALRGVSQNNRAALRTRLYQAQDFDSMIQKKSGLGIDELAESLRANYGLRLSFISKLAAFAQPETFIAWDIFARGGVAILRERAEGYKYQSYCDYLADVNQVWQEKLRVPIRDFLSDKKIPANAPRKAFQRRMLDVYLMLEGGRWHPPF